MAGLPEPAAPRAAGVVERCAAAGNVHASWRRLSGRGMGLLVLLVGVLLPIPACHAEAISKATSSRAAKEESLRALPLDRLTPEAREKILGVVRKPTLYRRMPLSLTYGDPRLNQFLVRNPEVVVNIWQLMGITKITLQRQSEYTFRAADGMGTTADVELVYGDQDTHLYYCRGTYDGSLYPTPITGTCVLLLKTGVVKESTGVHQLISRLDVFLDVDNVGVDVLTRTLHPLVARSADQNFTETNRFVERIWRTAVKHGDGMQNLAHRLDQVTPEQREQFTLLTAAVHRDSQLNPQWSRLAEEPDEETDTVNAPQLRR